MKQIYTLILFLSLSLTVGARNKAYAVNDVPNVQLKDASLFVSDPENILRNETKNYINEKLALLRKNNSIQVAVIALPSIGNNDCFEFAQAIGTKWGVGGKKKDTGLVILLVIDQGCIRLQTGYGIEGTLPDAICKRIIQRKMIPYFKQRNFDAGMINGVNAVIKRLDGTGEIEVADTEDGSESLSILLIMMGVFGSFFFLILARIRASKCPNCGKHKLQRTNSKLLYVRGDIKTEEITYTCLNCGHIIKRNKNSYINNINRRNGGGPFIGGFGGGGGFSGGGGGFSGGSWGGGSFGGGGAGGSF